jgi:hypothetical protein
MVKSAIHPGACTISEAVLCAGPRAGEVVSWAFANQEQIRGAAARDPGAAQQMVTRQFPDLGRCIGSAEVRSRLNRSLRWAVRNRLSVLTPQLYVGGVRLCDEDVDLGLDFTLSRMIDGHRNGTLKAIPVPGEPPPRPAVARVAGATKGTRRPGGAAGHASPASNDEPAEKKEEPAPAGEAEAKAPAAEPEAKAPAAEPEAKAPAGEPERTP